MSLRRSINMSYIWESSCPTFLKCLKCLWFTNSRVCVPSSPCILRAFLLNVSYAPSLFICQTWFHFFTYFPFFACFTCLHFYIYLTYPQYLRGFISFSCLKCLPSFLRVLRALIFLRVFTLLSVSNSWQTTPCNKLE